MASVIQSFGYVPDSERNKVIDIIYKFVGYPHLMRRIQARSIFRLIGSIKGKNILDVGCGNGLFCIEYCRRGAKRVTGIDVDENRIKNAKLKIEQASLNNKIQLMTGDAQAMPFEDNSFDVAVCNCALEHIEEDEIALKEINRCLRPKALLALTVPYASRNKILPIVDMMVKMPKFIQYTFAPTYIQNTESYEEAILKLKKRRFKEKRNYSLEEIKGKLKKANFELQWHENNIKFFAAICWDLITGLKVFHFNRGMYLAFPVMYLISLLDEFLPRNCKGDEIALKARKKILIKKWR